MSRTSCFHDQEDLVPPLLSAGVTVPDLVRHMGRTSFEARNVWRAAELLRRMIRDGDTIWLGVAGAGVAGGMGGSLLPLLQAGFLDVVCSTGAQIYHDLHFAFGLPVKRIAPHGWDDDRLRRRGDTRIYDIGVRERETLEAQDALIRRFVTERYDALKDRELASWEFNLELGKWAASTAPRPELSITAAAARLGVPVFWDSFANHSIGMNLVRLEREGLPLHLSAQRDVYDSAAIVYGAAATGFLELGGGGPKNFIQQTGPTLNQILSVPFAGADRGIQVTTAAEREGSLSGCTFGEAVTWGKYRAADERMLVQVWSEYSLVLPLLAAYALDICEPREPRRLVDRMAELRAGLEEAL